MRHHRVLCAGALVFGLFLVFASTEVQTADTPAEEAAKHMEKALKYLEKWVSKGLAKDLAALLHAFNVEGLDQVQKDAIMDAIRMEADMAELLKKKIDAIKRLIELFRPEK